MTGAGPASRLGNTSYPGQSDPTGWILSQRSPKQAVDPCRPYGWTLDVEPVSGAPAGEVRPVWTIFLANKECPWPCLMCDLWKHTLDEPLPSGAIVQQIDWGLAQFGGGAPAPNPAEASGARRSASERWLKLYNNGSFLDPAAIAPTDYPGIVNRARNFERLIVECHPALVPPRIDPFLRVLRSKEHAAEGVRLEVALGLETAHAAALERLNKRMTVRDFQTAARELRRREVDVRVFLLVHPPFIPADQALGELARSLECAFDAEASVVSLIPTRTGNGAMDELARAGLFREPSLHCLESAFDMALELRRGRVLVDVWDLERFSRCAACFSSRRNRLAAMNRTQRFEPRVPCPECRGAL